MSDTAIIPALHSKRVLASELMAFISTLQNTRYRYQITKRGSSTLDQLVIVPANVSPHDGEVREYLVVWS